MLLHDSVSCSGFIPSNPSITQPGPCPSYVLFIDLDLRRTDRTNKEVQRSGGGNSCIFVSELLVCLAMGEEGFI